MHLLNIESLSFNIFLPYFPRRSDLGKFDYLTMCIKEGLRCHAPIFFIQRQVTEDIEIEGYKIPAWTNIAINIYNVHHNATVWGPDHMEYKPDRFLHENISKMDSFAFIPFSAGQRYVCQI